MAEWDFLKNKRSQGYVILLWTIYKPIYWFSLLDDDFHDFKDNIFRTVKGFL